MNKAEVEKGNGSERTFQLRGDRKEREKRKKKKKTDMLGSLTALVSRSSLFFLFI